MAITRNINDDNTLAYLLKKQQKTASSELDTAVGALEEEIGNLWSLIYPVGAIYISTVSTSPASLFGGTWVRIQDTFLLAAGETYEAGSTGGSATHVHATGDLALTVAQMPWHGHQVRFHNNAGTKGTAYYYNGATKTYSTGAQAPGITWKGTTFVAAQDGAGDQAGAADPVGGGEAHNHGNTEAGSSLPPYLTVYVWERTE